MNCSAHLPISAIRVRRSARSGTNDDKNVQIEIRIGDDLVKK